MQATVIGCLGFRNPRDRLIFDHHGHVMEISKLDWQEFQVQQTNCKLHVHPFLGSL